MTTTINNSPLLSNLVVRSPGEPAPDLVDYRLVHRAMTVDFGRLANVAAELLQRPDAVRWSLLRRYLTGVVGEVHSHHQVEDEHVWPTLQAVAADQPTLSELSADHDRLDSHLSRALELVSAQSSSPQLVVALGNVAELLARHVADEENQIFPILADRLRLEDYERLQQHFRSNLRLRLLPFVVPWAVSHASPEERVAVLASAPRSLRILLAVFERPFQDRQQRLFAQPGLSTADRARVRAMRQLAVAHTWLLRRSAGRLGSRWVGGADVLMLTVRGRRSGTTHVVPLMCLHDGDDLLVAASHGGVDREPQWWLNLLADPRADVDLRGERFTVVAERVDSAERSEMWARFVNTWPGFDQYQARVQREIAVVRLRRTSSCPIA